MTDGAASDALNWAWNTQSVWSQGADKLKRSVTVARTAALTLTVVAAALATVATQLGDGSSAVRRVLTGIAAICAALVVLVQAAGSRERVEQWTRARAVSEAIKSEVYTCLATVGRYRGDDRAVRLRRAVDAIVDDAGDLVALTIDIDPTPRPTPVISDVAGYLDERVQAQITRYYEPKSREMKRQASHYRAIGIALAVIAAVLSAATTATGHGGVAAWLPVVSTVIAAVTAQAAVARYDATALEYLCVHRQLEQLVLMRNESAEASAESDDRFVESCERVIAAQNDAWMARTSAAAVDAAPLLPRPDTAREA